MEEQHLKRIAKFNIGNVEDRKRVELHINFNTNELILNAYTILNKDAAILMWTKIVTKIIPIDGITMETNFKDIIIDINEEIDVKLQTFKTLKTLFKDVDSIEVIGGFQPKSDQ